jgi:hypothetical protein
MLLSDCISRVFIIPDYVVDDTDILFNYDLLPDDYTADVHVTLSRFSQYENTNSNGSLIF